MTIPLNPDQERPTAAGGIMPKEIRARFSKGKIEPLEELELEEGEEIIISVRETPSKDEAKDAFERAAGAWKGKFDIDAFLEDLYASRRSQSREINL
jgi:predicted DNA-binding antitoxin AbrB/MazE fold protein